QRSPAYVKQVARVWRQAIDESGAHPEAFQVKPEWNQELAKVSEGAQTTLGAYNRPWQ
ncbi:MAG: U32 family peptidase, partial [Anaerolineae bacterium]|nr:U32 family peptidase [Anaerolineae bacterium]